MKKLIFRSFLVLCISSLSYANQLSSLPPTALAALKAAVATEAVSPVPGYECPPWPPCHYRYWPVGKEYPQECTNAAELREIIAFEHSANSCYTADPHNSINMNGGVMPASQVIAWLAANNAPAQFQQAARLIIVAQSEIYQSMSVSLTPSSGTVREVVGVANNVNGTVTIAFIDATSSATLMPKSTTKNQRVCHSCWLVATCCHNQQVTVPRGYTPAEEAYTLQTLRAMVYNSMLQQVGAERVSAMSGLKAPPLPGFHGAKIAWTDHASSFNGSLKGTSDGLLKDLGKSMSSFWSVIPDVINIFKSSRWQIVDQVKALGFETLHEDVQALKLLDVQTGKGVQILSIAAQMGLIPQGNQELLTILQELSQLTPEFTWGKASVTWADNGVIHNTVIYKTIDLLTLKEDWLFISFKGSFTLAPDTLIVITGHSYLGGLWSDENVRISQVPHIVTPSDITAISLLFEITAASVVSGWLGVPYSFPVLP